MTSTTNTLAMGKAMLLLAVGLTTVGVASGCGGHSSTCDDLRNCPQPPHDAAADKSEAGKGGDAASSDASDATPEASLDGSHEASDDGSESADAQSDVARDNGALDATDSATADSSADSPATDSQDSAATDSATSADVPAETIQDTGGPDVPMKNNWPITTINSYDCFAEQPTSAFVRASLRAGDPDVSVYTGGTIEPGHYVLTNITYWACSSLKNFDSRWTIDVLPNELHEHADEKYDGDSHEYRWGVWTHRSTSANTLVSVDVLGCYGSFSDDETYYYSYSSGQLRIMQKSNGATRKCVEMELQKQ